MPVKRRLAKGREHRITPEAIAAFEAGDYGALHRALGLRPWEASPLPLSVTSLGVDQDVPPDPHPVGWAQSVPQAQELQRLLMAAAGHPMSKNRRFPRRYE
jgi:hypothetical protein